MEYNLIMTNAHKPKNAAASLPRTSEKTTEPSIEGPITKQKYKRILYVDDEIGLRRAMGRKLKETGATEIVTARDVADAMTILQSDRNFDVIVCDLDMPGGNALKLIEQMKQTEIQIPVIVFSGGFLSATPEKILEAGALTVFEKGSESRLNDMIVRITGIINN